MVKNFFARFDWKDLTAFLVALVITGLGIAAQHPEVVLTVVVIVIVWVLNLLFNWKGIHLGKGWLTGILYVLSFLLTWLFQPSLVPALPVLAGAPQQAAGALYAWVGALLAASGPIVAYATGIYAILLARVLAKLLYTPVDIPATPAPPVPPISPPAAPSGAAGH